MSNSIYTGSSKSRYLSLLDGQSVQEVENRIVSCIESALEERQCRIPPVRLSPIARAFAIDPRPCLVPIQHDGEIIFDESRQNFAIRLRQPESPMTLEELAANPRYRFTYAHEMAHRFLFVKHGQTWRRALDLATEDLDPASRLREKITLSRIEEGLCNSIARRILIPDSFLYEHCPLDRWFYQGSKFYSLLTRAARICKVSRDVMLVRLEKWPHVNKGAYFAIIVDRSVGAITSRGKRMLRAMTGIFPSRTHGELYPGMPLDDLGSEIVQFASKAIATKDSVVRDFRLNLLLRGNDSICALGWWRPLARGDRFMMWGSLENHESSNSHISRPGSACDQ